MRSLCRGRRPAGAVKTFLFLFCIHIASGGFSVPLFAETEEGKEIFQKKLCHTCHGVAGISLYDDYPNLAGHDRAYILRQFGDIRSQARKNGFTIIMRTFPTVQTVSAEQIEAIADYLSQLR